MKFAHLHVRSGFSFQAGGSSPEDLAEAAVLNGIDAIALTDVGGVYGAVRFQRACKERGVKHIFGAEVTVGEYETVLLASSREGYANLCQLITHAHMRSRGEPRATIEELSKCSNDLFCLSGTGRFYDVLDEGGYREAVRWAELLGDIFGERLSLEVTHQLRKGDQRRVTKLIKVGLETGIPLLATGDVRYAIAEHYSRFDVLTCIRNGITLFDDHCERPSNAEAYIKPAPAYRELGIPEAALHRAYEVAEQCQVDLLPGYIIPPGARLPEGVTATQVLREKCEAGFNSKYAQPGDQQRKARRQLTKELSIVEKLDLEEFFLVVREVIEEAKRLGVRCSGRGSAANSIITYLLDITPVCPIENNLLFERFLHRGRKGTPDIDLDFDSSRRLEIVTWMEERFGLEHTGMSGTIQRYLTRSAVQECAKAFGWPAEMAVQMSKRCSHRAPDAPENREHLESVTGASPLLDEMIRVAGSLLGFPRHLGQHSGGMVLSRTPLRNFTPLQVSANGVRIVQFDKDDLEHLGLVKLDVLGLRMMGAVSEASEIVERHSGEVVDLDALPPNDPQAYEMIREGDVLGLFQIESPAQMSAGARLQATNMQDLIKQISVVRPGPILGGSMHPFLRRHQGLEKVQYDHPILEEVLADTYGIIIFQEQVLEVCYQFAGMTLEEADQFRRLMSKFRDPEEMEGMRSRFVASSMENGIKERIAHSVFDKVSRFVGYGFCRSHAAAFARTVYQSAYLKAHYPASFFAAVMQHRPGMYSLLTLEQDARRHGVLVLAPDINASFSRYELEKRNGRWAIRKPLTAVKGLSQELASGIVLERARGHFSSVEGFYHRVNVKRDVLTSLAQAGAFDGIEGPNRTALFKGAVLEQQKGSSGEGIPHSLFDLVSIENKDVPALPGISLKQRLELDLQTHRGARIHPMFLARRTLNDLEIRSVETVPKLGKMQKGGRRLKLSVGGLIMFRQMPPTANGTMFLFLEDETGHIQCIVHGETREKLGKLLNASALVVQGYLQVSGPWCGITVVDAWPLTGVIGGYIGRPGRSFGRDARVVAYSEAS